MNITLVIDRFEGKYAILESQEKNPLIFDFPRHLLPEGVKEGNVIRFSIDIDNKETEIRRKKIKAVISNYEKTNCYPLFSIFHMFFRNPICPRKPENIFSGCRPGRCLNHWNK